MNLKGTDDVLDSKHKNPNFPTHLIFLVLLAFILALKYHLYFDSPLTGTGFTARRLGATLSHLLIWAIAYSLCYKSSGNALLLTLGALFVFLGWILIPLIGWAGVIILYVVYRKVRRKQTAELGPGPASQSDTDKVWY